MNDKDGRAIANIEAVYQHLRDKALEGIDTSANDVPLEIEKRARIWEGVVNKIRAQETWMQWVRRIVKGIWR